MKNLWKHWLTVITFLSFGTTALAQGHAMHMEHGMDMAPKNVYLAMMDTMMTRMDRAPKGKTIAQEFLLQMIPHHLGAVDMARYEIAYGKNFEMIQLAKSILAEQQSELTTMHIWLTQPAGGNTVIPAGFVKAMGQSMAAMMRDMPPAGKLNNPDKAFASVMLPHHQAAIDMARAVLTYEPDVKTAAFAKMLISNEQIEIQQMFTYIQ